MDRMDTLTCTAGSLSARSSLVFALCDKHATVHKLVASSRIDKGSEENIQEDEEGDPDAAVVHPEGHRRSEVEQLTGAVLDTSVVPGRTHHAQIERRQHHAQVEYAPLTTVYS